MRHANMDKYSSVGPCAYSMCMMIELSSVQLSRLRMCAAGLAVRPIAVRPPPLLAYN